MYIVQRIFYELNYVNIVENQEVIGILDVDKVGHNDGNIARNLDGGVNGSNLMFEEAAIKTNFPNVFDECVQSISSTYSNVKL